MQQFEEINPLSPASNSAKKGAKTLSDLINKGSIDREQANFVICATDPFHDKPLNHLTGAPDGQCELSVTPSYVSQVTLSRPPGYTADTWSVMISNQSLLTSVSMGAANLLGNIMTVSPNTQADCLVGSVNFTTADGSADFSTIYQNPHFPPVNPPADALEGPLQVLGMAIEVEDITSALHRQGAFHCAIMNQHPYKLTALNCSRRNATIAVPNFNVGSFYEIRRPPANLAALSLLPNIVDWRAEDGCFAVIREHYDQFSHISTLPTYPILTNSDLPVGGPLPSESLPVTTVPLYAHDWGEGQIQATFPGNVVPNPSQMSVLMFTGLAAESVLQVRVRWFIQRFPTESQKQIIPLAKMPPSRNDKCYELISRVFTNLPPAVPFRENASGDWWKTILEGISSIAPAIGMIPHPIAQGIAAGASALGKFTHKEESEVDRLKRELQELKEQLKEFHKRYPLENKKVQQLSVKGTHLAPGKTGSPAKVQNLPIPNRAPLKRMK